jgi:hypothetical protein
VEKKQPMKGKIIPNKNEDPTSNEYIVGTELPEVLRAINKFIVPQKYGFKLSTLPPKSIPILIYESEMCKVRFFCSRDRPYASEPLEINVNYGRLYAPYERNIIDWNNEKCYCWQDLSLHPFLLFLDGLSPEKALQLHRPIILNEFLESSKNEKWPLYEIIVRMHSIVWKHYSQRLFSLFDLRNPEQWEEYLDFLREYDRIGNEKADQFVRSRDGVRRPRLYQIC